MPIYEKLFAKITPTAQIAGVGARYESVEADADFAVLVFEVEGAIICIVEHFFLLADRGTNFFRQIVPGTLRVGNVVACEENVETFAIDFGNSASTDAKFSQDRFFDCHFSVDQGKAKKEFPGHLAFVAHVIPLCM